MESPFLTKKITQKFPTLPGYTIPETPTRAIGDNEIQITTNGNYILGQNDEDPDDLEMDLDNNNNNNNNSKKLTLLKNQTRDEITPNYVLGKLNVNIQLPIITSPITSNGYYKFNGNTLISGTNQDYNINVQVNSNPKISIKNIKYFTMAYYDISFKYKNTPGSVYINDTNGKDIIKIGNSNDSYNLLYYHDYTGSSIELRSGEYIGIFNNPTYGNETIYIYDNNNNIVLGFIIKNNTTDTSDDGIFYIYKNVFELNLENVTNYQ